MNDVTAVRQSLKSDLFEMHEIYNLRLPADLVVLSACQTALGKEIKGEGLVGLTRGFMYAGAERVVASLWQVDDLATAELMKRFYQGMLKDRLRPAEALRAAQIEKPGVPLIPMFQSVYEIPFVDRLSLFSADRAINSIDAPHRCDGSGSSGNVP